MDASERAQAPTTGAELETLLGFLNHQRDTLRWKCAGLDAAQLDTRSTASALTLGGLLGHLSLVEVHWFRVMLHGEEPHPPFDVADWKADRDWEMTWARGRSPEDLLTLFDDAVRAADEGIARAVAADGLETRGARVSHRTRKPFTLRWILLHMIEEHSRHNGHADLIREGLDGVTGA
ncbi:DinB family protein [Nocardioides dubius]|uniref:DinB family protein n=1 Tax=Nocardioides dubius TaxID=317019 RepID=A0ABP4EM66_9ACTN